jgi:NADH-quinone oxidoreductase subunit C
MSDEQGSKVPAQPTDAAGALEVPGASYEGPVRRGMWSDGPGDTSGYGRIARVIEPPLATESPMGSWYDAAAGRLTSLVSDAIVKAVVDRGELTFYIRRENVTEVFRELRDDAHLRFEVMSGVSGVHYPEATGEELHVVYHLLSMTHNRRLRVETTAPDSDPHVPSVTPIYPAADWHERETWDMFGIVFDGHPALTRILMPDDWVGHPQRKDYPLGGIPVEYKGAVVAPPDERRTYR